MHYYRSLGWSAINDSPGATSRLLINPLIRSSSSITTAPSQMKPRSANVKYWLLLQLHEMPGSYHWHDDNQYWHENRLAVKSELYLPVPRQKYVGYPGHCSHRPDLSPVGPQAAFRCRAYAPPPCLLHLMPAVPACKYRRPLQRARQHSKGLHQ